MSTRSTVGVVEGDGFRGRYCHWDGYPTWMGMALTKLIKRDGHEKVIKTIMGKASWSSIDPNTTADETYDSLTGYGRYHADEDFESYNIFGPHGWQEAVGGSEWAYAINPEDGRVSVFKCHWDGSVAPRLLGSFDPYTVDDSELERLEVLGYGD